MKTSSIKWLHICIIAVVCVISGCATTSRDMVARINPNFDYTPNETVAGNTGITFAAVGSQLSQRQGNLRTSSLDGTGLPRIPMIQRFISNMAADFGEVITARGYTLRGPFKTYDEMTFVDKDNSNLILTANIDFNVDYSATRIEYKRSILLSSLSSYAVSGSVAMRPRVTLLINESLTNEKMWTKSVNITPINVYIESSGYPSGSITFEEVLANDDEAFTELGMQLEKMYNEILNRAYGYLDPREISLLNKQAAELRKRKTF